MMWRWRVIPAGTRQAAAGLAAAGIIALRDQIQREQGYAVSVRVGAGGGISTPDSALGAYMMGAAFLVTGSVNQACLESGACEHTRSLLAQADMADVSMAPSADMFEMGARVQVLKKGTFFPMRAQKLYDLYTTAALSMKSRLKRAKNWRKRFSPQHGRHLAGNRGFFQPAQSPADSKRGSQPKKKMALIFRWYLGLASRWSRDGVEDRAWITRSGADLQ
jgi:PfaD family protein